MDELSEGAALVKHDGSSLQPACLQTVMQKIQSLSRSVATDELRAGARARDEGLPSWHRPYWNFNERRASANQGLGQRYS